MKPASFLRCCSGRYLARNTVARFAAGRDRGDGYPRGVVSVRKREEDAADSLDRRRARRMDPSGVMWQTVMLRHPAPYLMNGSEVSSRGTA